MTGQEIMDKEYITKVLPLNDELQAHIDALTLDGWTITPGTIPVGIWHLCRDKQDEIAVAAKFKIDDSKVHVVSGEDMKRMQEANDG